MTSQLSPLKTSTRSAASGLGRRGPIGSCLVALALLTTGCSQHGIKGQVIATVNGQEITPQDLQAEARSSPTLAGADSSILLQRVVARTLLAQAAHNQGVDNYPGYPSDIARLKQEFIAQRFARASLKTPPAPTPAELAKVMADNPYAFAQRQNVTIDDLTMQPPASAVASLVTLKYPADVITRLTRLNIPYSRRTVTLDTAKVPGPLAARLAMEPIGELFFVRNDTQLAAMTITGRAPIVAPPEVATASATQIFEGAKVQQQIRDLVGHLRTQAKIVYGNGFVPPKGAEGGAALNAVGSTPGATN